MSYTKKKLIRHFYSYPVDTIAESVMLIRTSMD